MPNAKKPPERPMPNEQHKLFEQAARELGCDDSEEAFGRALKKIVKAPPPKSVQKRKATRPAPKRR